MTGKNALCCALFLIVCAGILAAEGPAGVETPPPADGVVAYYFYGDVRCATCRKLEAYSNEAITAGFPMEIESGDLVWRAVNVDGQEDAHFVDDFQLVTKAVVLVEYRDGNLTRWENLDKIWTLVRNKENFVQYVQTETRGFLEAG